MKKRRNRSDAVGQVALYESPFEHHFVSLPSSTETSNAGSIVCLILGDADRDYPWESWRRLPSIGSYSQLPTDGGIVGAALQAAQRAPDGHSLAK